MAKRKKKKKSANINLEKRRTWLRNVPLLLGLFSTYLLTVGSIRDRAVAETLSAQTLALYAAIGVMALLGSSMVFRRFWAARLSLAPDTNSSHLFYILSESMIYLLGGVGIGFLMMAAIGVTLLLF